MWKIMKLCEKQENSLCPGMLKINIKDYSLASHIQFYQKH